MPQQLVYVHGAGQQKPASVLKHDIDMLLFGKDMSSTRLAYYANVRWPGAGVAGPSITAAGSSRPRRTRAINRALDPALTPTEAADEIVGATLRGPGGAGVAPGMSPTQIAEARKLVQQLYRRADRVASRSAASPITPGAAFGPTFPDSMFRWVVGKFASDVIDYLYGPFKKQMQAPVVEALRKTPRPKVIVAHSLGTIITYDVLADPSMTGLKDDLLVTIGCPLGIGNVQNKLRDGAARPHPVPPMLNAWANFADRWDPVALDQTMRDEFEPPKRMPKDEQVNNPAPDNHELMGYLSVAIVRDTIVAAAG